MKAFRKKHITRPEINERMESQTFCTQFPLPDVPRFTFLNNKFLSEVYYQTRD